MTGTNGRMINKKLNSGLILIAKKRFKIMVITSKTHQPNKPAGFVDLIACPITKNQGKSMIELGIHNNNR
jgi:hypothetical protein